MNLILNINPLPLTTVKTIKRSHQICISTFLFFQIFDRYPSRFLLIVLVPDFYNFTPNRPFAKESPSSPKTFISQKRGNVRLNLTLL